MLKVSTPDGKLTRLVEASQRQEYIDKGWIIEDTSEIEMILDEDGNTLWRYKEDTEWNTMATDTYKVKVDGADTAAYLEDKLVEGSNVTIEKLDGKLKINLNVDNIYTDAEKEKVNAVNAVGTTVASDTTITVPANKTIFHVTGTTAISTINLPYSGFTGKISIIPDEIFTFDTAGNIAETYTATVNRCIDLVYDGTKWYRV